jgi:L-alanine-DL-glutamate epimerase-like enolase superfamily enzyme
MKITSVEAIPIRVARARQFAAAQAVLTHSDFALVKIETDAGVTGFWGGLERAFLLSPRAFPRP